MTPGNSALTASATAAKRSSCSSKKPESGFVGGREVGPDPGQLEVGVLGAGAGESRAPRRVAVAEPAHAAVVLDVDAGRPALGAGAGRRRARGSPRARPRPPSRRRARRRGRRRSAPPSSAAARAGSGGRSAAASAPVATASRVAPPASAAVRAGVGAVAVAVGLDHRAELDALAAARPSAARSCARRRRGRSGRLPAPWLVVGDERGQRVGPGDHARRGGPRRRPPAGGCGASRRSSSPPSRRRRRRGRRPGRRSSAPRRWSRRPCSSRSSKPFIEPTKTIAAHDVEVVRQVQVGLLLAEDQVGLADDADHLVARRRRPGSRPSRSWRAARSRLRASSSRVTVGTSASMISAAVFIGGEVIRPARPGRSPTGIESITSVAITDSAAPIRAAASRPARAWARTAAQAAAKGSRPRASSAAVMPESTSPVPAVARPGAESALTATRSPSVTIVSSPLRTTTAPAARGRLARAGEAVGGDLRGVAAEQPAELAGVRGEDRRRRRARRSSRVCRRRR